MTDQTWNYELLNADSNNLVTGISIDKGPDDYLTLKFTDTSSDVIDYITDT